MRILAVLILLASTIPVVAKDLESQFDQDVLIVDASDYGCFRFDVYLARNDAQRERGLMFVRDLPDNEGMLFVNDREVVLSMWMKNTFIPLDIIFARSDGTIINVVRNTKPLSMKEFWSGEPAKFVLELNAGITRRLAIDEDSRIIWSPGL
jgi:uncharacterized membrane protein (UPF0127 family)